MIRDEGHAADIGKAVLTATLCAIATGLVTWGMEKLREKVDPKAEKDDDSG